MSFQALRLGSQDQSLLGAGGHDHASTHEPGTGSISSWDISTGTDGPGTRFVLFTAGCPLRCQYCHNPETWHMKDGHVVGVDEVLQELSKYVEFISASGGGITVTGGEPAMQPQFVKSIFEGARDLGLHTALDTAGSLPITDRIESLLGQVDLVLLDIKAGNADLYHELTGGRLDLTLEFARHAAECGKRVWLRYVLVPGLTDDLEDVARIAGWCREFGNVDRVDVLPYHELGVHKYQELGIAYPLVGTRPPVQATLQAVIQVFREAGLSAF